jgi:hypothetical protein
MNDTELTALLKTFCYPCPDLCHPSQENLLAIDGRTYATNGKMLVECTRPLAGAEEIGELCPAPGIRKVLALESSQWTALSGWYELPLPLPPAETQMQYPQIECECCKGSGEVEWTDAFGHEYSAECQECDGYGTVDDTSKALEVVEKQTPILLSPDEPCFDLRLLHEMSALPGLQVHKCPIPTSAPTLYPPLAMRWEYGRALLMPLRTDKDYRLGLKPIVLTDPDDAADIAAAERLANPGKTIPLADLASEFGVPTETEAPHA